MDFSKLGITDLRKYPLTPNESFKKLDFNKDVLKKAPKLTKEELKVVEPGIKIPISNFQQIGQWCDECEDVQTHVHSPEKKKLRCLKCKTTKYYN